MSNTTNVDLNQCDTDSCEKCGFQFYKERYIMKRIPGVLTGSSTDQYIPVKFFACEKCGTVHKSTRINITPKDDTLKFVKGSVNNEH